MFGPRRIDEETGYYKTWPEDCRTQRSAQSHEENWVEDKPKCDAVRERRRICSILNDDLGCTYTRMTRGCEFIKSHSFCCTEPR